MPLVLQSAYELSPVVNTMFDCLVMRQDKPVSRECLTSVHEQDGTLLNLNEQEYMSYSPRLGSIYESLNIQCSFYLAVTVIF
jgi:hypothetical protein